MKKTPLSVVSLYNFLYLCIVRKIVAYKTYFRDFIQKLSDKERGKVLRALDIFKMKDRIPSRYIKYMRDGIYEFRVNYGQNEFRIFFMYEGDTLVILFNCLRKKTQQTLDHELKKALKLKKEYDETKRNK